MLKDNVVWSSTEDGYPLCTFRSFGTNKRPDGTIAMNLTSSDDEARVFKSEELQASLVATLDALAAAIAQKKAEIVSRSTHPEAAFTLRSALEDTVAVVVPTQESTGAVDGTITPTKNNKKEEAENKKKKKVVSQLGPFPARRRLPATVASRRSTRNETLNDQQAHVLKVAKVALLVQRKRQTRSGDRNELQEKIVTVTRPEHGNASLGEPVNM